MQVLKYKWADFSTVPNPQIIAITGMGVQKVPLLNRKFSIHVGKKKCIGSFRKGNHVPCAMSAENTDLCGACAVDDDYCMCMRCSGEKCINEKQRNECSRNNYYIYLAAFHNILKVGISLDRRVMERLIEQGADMGAIVMRVQDGLIVRQIEQEVCKYLGAVDRLRGSQKQRLLFGSPNIAASNIRNAISKLQSNGFSKHLIAPEIHDLRPYYMLEKVPYNPRPLTISDNFVLNGTCIASKGNVLVFSNESGLFSINAHELIGREIEIISN